MWSEDLYIKTISHDEIVPLPIAKYLENFNVSRNIEDSRRRPKWLKENGKHYIYYHGTNGSRGMFNEYNSVSKLRYFYIIPVPYKYSHKQTFS